VSKELLTDRVDVSIPVLNEHYDTRNKERKREHRLEVLEMIFDDYGDPDATIDAGVLVDMFVNKDGTVDTNALIDYKNNHESEPEDQMTFDQLTDGSTGMLHPGALPVIGVLAAGRLMFCRFRRELSALTTRPGTSLRPSNRRIAEGAAGYSLFVTLVAFNLVCLGLVS
jgi:hypothetical protein